MRKKYLSALLFGALLFASAGTFTSCKDYDDDINNLQTQITANADAIKKLQDMVGEGKWVTSVVGIENGIKVTMNDGSSTDILGIDGEDGTVVTIIDGYWAFDGVKSEYPATPGSAGEAHEIKISEDGYWMIWDTEKGEYVTTTYAVAPISAAKNPADGSWTITIKNADGTTSSITIASAALTHIEVIRDKHDDVYPNWMDYNYGIVRTDVKWGWNEDKVMGAGMYSKLGTDMLLLLNPAGVEGDTYKYTLKNSAGTEAPVTFFDTAEPYTGKPLARATSATALWTLPAHITKTEANDIEKRRRDLYLNFKINDDYYYDLAVEATSPEGGKVFSDYVSKVQLASVKGTETLSSMGSQECLIKQSYEPTFEGSAAGVIYDYELRLNQDAENLKRASVYGAKVTEDGHAWIAEKEAGVYNPISFDIIYILLDGTVQKIENYVTVNFTAQLTEEKDAFYLEDATAYVATPLKAEYNKDLSDAIGGNVFIHTSKEYDLADLVAKFSDAEKLVWNQAVEKYQDDASVFSSTLIGGDGENNYWGDNKDVAEHISYVIKDNKIQFKFAVSSIYANNFILDKAYQYTISVVDPDNKGAKLATIVLPFEFTQPELDITRVNGEKAIWTSETELRVYGDKVVKDNVEYMYAPLYEAFTTAYTKQYSEFVPTAEYYKLSCNIIDPLYESGYWSHTIINDEYQDLNANLSEIAYSPTAEGWNTYTSNMWAIQQGVGIPIHAEYYFYGVYPATKEQVKDFTLRFSSLLGDGEVKANSEFTSTTVTREVILTDKDFTLVDALKDQFYLFDGVNANGDIVKRSVLNSNQKFEEGTEGFDLDFILENATIKVKDANGKDISIKVENGKVHSGTLQANEDGEVVFTDKTANVAFYENKATRTRGWIANTAPTEKILVTNLDAKQADKTNGYAAIPGGIMIQLPSSIGTTEPVTLEFELVDVFGVTKTLSVTVKAAK